MSARRWVPTAAELAKPVARADVRLQPESDGSLLRRTVHALGLSAYHPSSLSKRASQPEDNSGGGSSSNTVVIIILVIILVCGIPLLYFCFRMFWRLWKHPRRVIYEETSMIDQDEEMANVAVDETGGGYGGPAGVVSSIRSHERPKYGHIRTDSDMSGDGGFRGSGYSSATLAEGSSEGEHVGLLSAAPTGSGHLGPDGSRNSSQSTLISSPSPIPTPPPLAIAIPRSGSPSPNSERASPIRKPPPRMEDLNKRPSPPPISIEPSNSRPTSSFTPSASTSQLQPSARSQFRTPTKKPTPPQDEGSPTPTRKSYTPSYEPASRLVSGYTPPLSHFRRTSAMNPITPPVLTTPIPSPNLRPNTSTSPDPIPRQPTSTRYTPSVIPEPLPPPPIPASIAALSRPSSLNVNTNIEPVLAAQTIPTGGTSPSRYSPTPTSPTPGSPLGGRGNGATSPRPMGPRKPGGARPMSLMTNSTSATSGSTSASTSAAPSTSGMGVIPSDSSTAASVWEGSTRGDRTPAPDMTSFPRSSSQTPSSSFSQAQAQAQPRSYSYRPPEEEPLTPPVMPAALVFQKPQFTGGSESSRTSRTMNVMSSPRGLSNRTSLPLSKSPPRVSGRY